MVDHGTRRRALPEWRNLTRPRRTIGLPRSERGEVLQLRMEIHRLRGTIARLRIDRRLLCNALLRDIR